ncbi:MAG: three-Cys-motif partner protein TcmP [Anaerolineales bacterium]
MQRTDDKYWAEYDGLQHAKHQILRSYLGGWFPILGSWQGRVLYIDCHAGRGRHQAGEEGSPIIALRLLLEHKARKRILSGTEIHFYFFEIDDLNFRRLKKEIRGLGDLPDNVVVHPHFGDYEGYLSEAIADLKKKDQQMAAAFAFVDPYGFSISMRFLNEVLQFPATELFVNFMYRWVDMAIRHPGHVDNMNSLFDTSEWRELLGIDDPDRRSQAAIDLFGSQLRAEHVTHIYMRGANNALKYVLFHATNHRKGRELMKSSIWSVTPDGSFSASERDSPNQPVLITAEPDFGPLEDALWNKFGGTTVKSARMDRWLVDQLYLPKHLHDILREYRKRDWVAVSDYDPPFSFGQNPTFRFPKKRPSQ